MFLVIFNKIHHVYAFDEILEEGVVGENPIISGNKKKQLLLGQSAIRNFYLDT